MNVGPAEPPLHSYTSLPPELEVHPAGNEFAGVLNAAGFTDEMVDALAVETFDGVDHGAQDADDRRAVETELRQLWGTGYEENVANIRRYLKNNLPPGASDLLMNSRIGGKALFNNPALLVHLNG